LKTWKEEDDLGYVYVEDIMPAGWDPWDSGDDESEIGDDEVDLDDGDPDDINA
jgi:hypothetical protein